MRLECSVGGAAGKRYMRAASVVKADVAADPGTRFGYIGVGPKVDLLGLEAPPGAFHEDVVTPGALTVPAGPDLPGCQTFDEGDGCEPTALVGAELRADRAAPRRPPVPRGGWAG